MDFVAAVRHMRQCQKDHERILSQDSLTRKREAEEEVDRQLKTGVAVLRTSKNSSYVEADARKLAVFPFPWSKEEFEHPNFTEPKA